MEREAEEYFRYHERMRGFQQALRDILEDALDGDMEAVEAHALEAVPGGSPTEEGAQEQQGEPTEEEESRREARREATPRAFQGMMQETHGQFRNLAQDARELGDPAHTKRQLVGIQDVCVSCHSAYRFEKR
ncbi:hypothetical protein CKO14_09555 [Halorhodospira halophila]|nr:hypothetical protein [Halorhodospira halophila]